MGLVAQRAPIIIVLFAAIAVGYLSGGRLRRLGDIRLHWWGIAFAGVIVQALPAPQMGILDSHASGAAILISSYLLLLVFLSVNRSVPAARVMALGLLMNLGVVALNGGMPVSAWAIREASGASTDAGLAIAESSPKHHLMTEDDLLAPLGDVLPLPPPASVVLSVGDVFLYAGMAWLVIQVMRGRSRVTPRPFAMWFPQYRGKHAPVHWRMPTRYRSTDRAVAAQQGTGP